MWIDDAERIPQSVITLLALEKRCRGRPLADRVKLLRLLKARTVRSMRRAAALLGYSERQLQRWWATYTMGGLEELLRRPARPGRQEQVSAEAWTALTMEMRAGRIARLKDVPGYLQDQWGIA